jgi:hypothetical protein
MLATIFGSGSRAAECRRKAQRCCTRADKSRNWQEEDSWLELASAWAELADAFENEHRLSLN